MDPKPILREVVDLLTWKETSGTPALCRTLYEELLDSQMRRVGENNDEARCILDAVGFLPRRRRRAFLRAPLVASRLLGWAKGEPFDAGPIAKSLVAELATVGIDCEVLEPVWTALGDRCIDPADPERQTSSGPPIANTHIVIDSAGPIDFSACESGPLTFPSHLEWVVIKQALAQAARGIESTSPAAFETWEQCVDVVAVRTLSQFQQSFSSNSLVYNARVSLLINAHLRATNSAVIASALLHEAIHSLLFMWEEIAEPFFVGTRPREDVRIISPWSGKPLFLPAYIHACFVWYALYWFWKVAVDRRTWPTEESRAFVHSSRSGFDRCPFSTLSHVHKAYLSPEINEALAEVEDRVRSD
jgi:hypothetical protein